MMNWIENFLSKFCTDRTVYWQNEAGKWHGQLKECQKRSKTRNERIDYLEKEMVELQIYKDALHIPAPKTKGEADSSQVLAALKDQLGAGATYYMSDQVYKLTTRKEMERFLKIDQTDKMGYLSGWRDCDDFAYRLMGMLSGPGWSDLATGFTWGDYGGPHAIALFVDDKLVVWLIEPQNDSIMLARDKIKKSGWKPYLVMM